MYKTRFNHYNLSLDDMDDDDDRLISDEERKVMLEYIRKVLFASDNLPLHLDLMKDFENCD